MTPKTATLTVKFQYNPSETTQDEIGGVLDAMLRDRFPAGSWVQFLAGAIVNDDEVR
jgi:hypothetical protein